MGKKATGDAEKRLEAHRRLRRNLGAGFSLAPMSLGNSRLAERCLAQSV